MATQHYIQKATGAADLAKMYGKADQWKALLRANFGEWGASYVYPWLRDNGGRRFSSDPTAPTGAHWGWEVGMVVNIPFANVSLSPYEPGMDAVPGGPLVAIDTGEMTIAGDPLPPREPAPAGPDKTKEEPPNVPKVAAVAGGAMMWLLIAGVLVFILIQKKKKKPAKKKKKVKRRLAKKVVRFY